MHGGVAVRLADHSRAVLIRRGETVFEGVQPSRGGNSFGTVRRSESAGFRSPFSPGDSMSTPRFVGADGNWEGLPTVAIWRAPRKRAARALPPTTSTCFSDANLIFSTFDIKSISGLTAFVFLVQASNCHSSYATCCQNIDCIVRNMLAKACPRSTPLRCNADDVN